MKNLKLIFQKLSSIMDIIRKFKENNPKLFFILVAVLLLAMPYIISQYALRIAIMIGIYSILALSLNMVTGYTGQVSLGHAAFYALGAYCSALLTTKLEMNFFITIIISAVFAAVFGLLLGIPVLRLSGTYLAITTLGFCEVVRMVFLNWESVTNGALGVTGIPKPSLFGYNITLANKGYYYLVLVFLVITVLCVVAIIRSKMGRAMIAIREDETAAAMMGIRTTKYKIIAFVVSAFFSGLAGALYAHLIGYIDPNTFTFDTSIMILSIVILGGMGTIEGMFLGAVLLVSFPEVLRFMQEYRFVVYGLILVIMMRFRPQGILGGQKSTKYKLPKGLVDDSNVITFKRPAAKSSINTDGEGI